MFFEGKRTRGVDPRPKKTSFAEILGREIRLPHALIATFVAACIGAVGGAKNQIANYSPNLEPVTPQEEIAEVEVKNAEAQFASFVQPEAFQAPTAEQTQKLISQDEITERMAKIRGQISAISKSFTVNGEFVDLGIEIKWVYFSPEELGTMGLSKLAGTSARGFDIKAIFPEQVKISEPTKTRITHELYSFSAAQGIDLKIKHKEAVPPLRLSDAAKPPGTKMHLRTNGANINLVTHFFHENNGKIVKEPRLAITELPNANKIPNFQTLNPSTTSDVQQDLQVQRQIFHNLNIEKIQQVSQIPDSKVSQQGQFDPTNFTKMLANPPNNFPS